MRKYLLTIPGILLSLAVFSQEMSSKKLQPVVTTETKTENTGQSEKNVQVNSRKQVTVTETPAENPGKKEEETPATTETTSRKKPK